MKIWLWIALAAGALAGVASAQERDFLSGGEAAQIKDAQDPNQRIALYVQIAKRRIDLVKSLLTKERSGRALMIHDALEDYSKVIDAIDDVADDALQRKVDVRAALDALQGYEQDMLPMLERIRSSQPKDIERYDFVLKMAIDSTADSIELARANPDDRAKDLEVKAAQDKKAMDALRASPIEKKNADGETKPADAAQPAQPQKKPPTLLKPGEKLDPLGSGTGGRGKQ